MIRYLELGAHPPWQVESLLYRQPYMVRRKEKRAKVDKRRTSVPTLKDLMTPQTRHLFTINYDIRPTRPMLRADRR